MDEMRELYQETILDHHRRPRNFRELENATHSSEGFNPLCGDRITVYLLVEGNTIREIAFTGSGCAICTASASVMTEMLTGKSFEEAETAFGRFHDLVTGDPTETADTEGLGKMAVFFGVREYPVRIKCATLAWHTLKAALAGKDESVSTE
jgi:nitrogen fixation protein NifU and related proteins